MVPLSRLVQELTLPFNACNGLVNLTPLEFDLFFHIKFSIKLEG